jgi:hypothetical protein
LDCLWSAVQRNCHRLSALGLIVDGARA